MECWPCRNGYWPPRTVCRGQVLLGIQRWLQDGSSILPSRRAERRLAWERRARLFRLCSASGSRSGSSGPNRCRGSISRTTRYTSGRVIRGIFPPILLQPRQEGSAQQAHGYVMMPAGPATGLVFVQPHVALVSLQFGVNAPPGTAQIRQNLQSRVFGSVGQVVSGLAAVQVPAPYRSMDFAALAPPGRPYPLGMEQVSARPLASLGHRYFLPVLPGDAGNPLFQGAPFHDPESGLAGRPPGPGTAGMSTQAPQATP